MRSVSILGGGWLGLPLALFFKENHFDVKISTTSIDKIAVFDGYNLSSYLIKVEKEGTPDPAFLDSEIFIISFPPKLKTENPEDYLLKINTLANAISGVRKLKKVVFVSSTSVYDDSNGLKSESDADPRHPLFQAEKIMSETLIHKQLIVARMAGLMGYDRNPCKYFGKRDFVAESVVNYIHRDDAVEILGWLAEYYDKNLTLNISAPLHPSRGAISEIVCKNPHFQSSIHGNTGKIIDTDLLKEIYPKNFHYPDPLKFKYL